MRGTGRTVFNGNKIEDFQVEILGVLDNIGPKESLILARLSGGPLEHTGVMQGMSGSPVYIDGKLVGAVAMAFPFAKDPIAGIRPIEAMLRTSSAATPPSSAPAPAAAVQRAALALNERDLTRRIPRPEPVLGGEARMIDIATPLSFGGFSRATLDAFAPQLRALGLEPRQGVTSGGKIEPAMGNPADLKPGSMISVQLMAGDLSVGADGTVTHIDGNRIYAFGHRFLDIGSTALPFARAEVLTLLANTNTSFKISTAKEWMGTIYQDRNTAVAGELGKRPPMVPGLRQPLARRQTGGELPDADGQRRAAFAAAAADGGVQRHRRHRAHRRRQQHPRYRARSNSRTHRPRCASIICTPPTTEVPCWPLSPPPSPSPSSCRAASNPCN